MQDKKENSTEISERIKKIIDYLGVTANKFSKVLGYDRAQTVYDVINGKSSPSFDFLRKLESTEYSDTINISWLLTGEGDMIRSKKQAIMTVNEPEYVYKKKGVPYYDVDFIGGFNILFDTQENKPSFYIDYLPFNDADCWVNITGHSMAPHISHGDIVALKQINESAWQEFLLFGEVYAIITEEFRTIKVIGKGKDDDHIALIPLSTDKEFSEQQLPKKLITHLYRVKGSIRKFF